MTLLVILPNMDTLYNHLQQISPQAESFWNEHAHPVLNLLVVYAPVIIPTLAVCHNNPPFMLKVCISLPSTPLSPTCA